VCERLIENRRRVRFSAMRVWDQGARGVHLCHVIVLFPFQKHFFIRGYNADDL